MPDTTVHVSGTPTPPEKLPQKRTQHIGKLGPNLVALYIGAEVEPLILNVIKEATLGRYSPNNTTQPTLDLTSYNAYKSGVSRLHATLHRTSTDELMISDRASGNGTYLNGIRLAPFIAARLVSGDHIELAQLDIEIYFGAEPGTGNIQPPDEAQVFSLHRSQEPTAGSPGDLSLVAHNTPPPDTIPASVLAAQATLTLAAVPNPAPPTHFHGEVDLHPEHIFSQMGFLTERLLQQLAEKPGIDLALVMKIEAKSASGFDEATVQSLKTLCEELKFHSATFDSEN